MPNLYYPKGLNYPGPSGFTTRVNLVQRKYCDFDFNKNIILFEQTNDVSNILDIQFLHGYNQPTLLILYEPLKTFPG